MAKIKPRNKTVSKLGFLLLYALAGLFLILDNKHHTTPKTSQQSLVDVPSLNPEIEKDLGAFPIIVPTMRYGFAVDTFQVVERQIRRNDFLANILLDQQIDYPTIEKLVQNADGVFDIKNLRTGKDYVFLTKDSTSGKPEYFIYEPNVFEYVVFELKDSLRVTKVEREVTTVVNTAQGTIESSLWNTMVDNGLSFDLAVEMENALQWSIDFHHIQKGDEFKLVFEEKHVEDKVAGIGQLKAAYFRNYDKEFYAIYFEGEEENAFYNLEGKPMKRAFLKAPVKYSRISSYYNLNRFHPVLRRRRPHLGTDYAAPYGTPIYAVGNGVVTKASYTKGNGRFVKIRHDKSYETQYLHMQKFAKGIKPGIHVEQGDVIGYVGSSGLATGPHVCFRFWKDGRQINHMRLNFPAKDPLPVKELPGFFEVRDDYLGQMGFDLQNMDLPTVEVAANEGDSAVSP